MAAVGSSTVKSPQPSGTASTSAQPAQPHQPHQPSTAAATETKPIQVKLVLLGEAAVGKSSVVNRYVTDQFTTEQAPTIGAAFLTQKCVLPDKVIKFEIWDTAGQERFHALAPMYYRNALAALVVFDLTRSTSFEKAKSWIVELKNQGSSNIIIALIGNKLDIQSERQIDGSEALEYAAQNGLMYFETSAKSGHGVMEVFTEIAKKIPIPTTTTQKANTGKISNSSNSRQNGSGGGVVNLNNSNSSVRPEQSCC